MKTKSLLTTRGFLALIGVFGNLALAPSSDATPMLFTLTGVSFNDGSTASGSFVFNPANQTYGRFNIITNNSSNHSGSTYSSSTGTTTN